MERAFVIRPFGTKKDSSGREIDFELVHDALIRPALTEARLGGGTTGQVVESGNIRDDMFSLILEADLAVCDVTIHNANAFYELGIRHALRKRSTILVRGEPSADVIPFDLLTDRFLKYDLADPAASVPALVEMIQASLRTDRRTDSPVFRMMEGLAEAEPASVEVVPLDFREEVERARAGSSKGWLRLLAEDVRGHRFQWTGLKLIGEAQWVLEDYDGARGTLETIPETHEDPATSLMLANVYERLYRERGAPELLTLSDQAIQRVLASGAAKLGERVEAHTLKARNLKTRWREEFKGLAGLEERREAAMNQKLRDTFQAYREAHRQDLNNFYPALAALQMGEIFLDLSSAGETWKSAFDTDREADGYREGLAGEVQTLRLLVRTAVDAAMERPDAGEVERIWARIGNANLLYLTDGGARRIVKRFRDAIPPGRPVIRESVVGQLELFASLGFKAGLTDEVLAALAGPGVERKEAEGRPVHLVVFVGHRVDEEGRTPPRFPAAHAGRAAERMRETLARLGDGCRLEAMASGAPGGDILFHELCAGLGVPCTLCLPMPAVDYSREVFGDEDGWRGRFLNLHRAMKKESVLELSNTTALPRWLQGTSADPWERGNRWVLKMALAAGADRTTLIALWDGKDHGGARGGTAHMVHITRQAGTVYVERIDTNALLGSASGG